MAIYALVDCDSFFASCEKIFRPDLRNKPVVVLSNNDGVIVARSKEAKALGFKMAEPFFKVETELKKKKVHIFSANFSIYSDISNRVMNTLEDFTPEIEVYSIDEAFLKLDGFEDPTKLAWQIRKSVWKWIGVPVSIGIGPTKTLAKLATEHAKRGNGVFNMLELPDLDSFLKQFSVEEVWGVGYNGKKLLNSHKIFTAFELKNISDQWAQSRLNVVGQRTINELRGIACIGMDESPSPQKSIIRSRSFGAAVHSFKDLSEAVSSYATTAAQRLRQQGSVCGCVSVFVGTRGNKYSPKYGNSMTKKLRRPTADTSSLINHCNEMLKRIYKKGYEYVRAGVVFFDLEQQESVPGDLFESVYNESKEHALMNAIDIINRKMGDNTLTFAASGIKKRVWNSKHSLRSPNYTSSWDELPIVKAK